MTSRSTATLSADAGSTDRLIALARRTAPTGTVVFAERVRHAEARLTWVQGRSPAESARTHVEEGWCVDGPGGRHVASPPSDGLSVLPDAAGPEFLGDLLDHLRAAGAGRRIVLHWRTTDRRVAVSTGDGRAVHRREAWWAVRVADGAGSWVVRGHGTEPPDPWATAETALAALEGARAPNASVPSGTPVVLSGPAAVRFFHEVLGHPLEADWGSRGGRPPAGLPSWLGVRDEPAAAFDDEGTPCRSLELVRDGAVVARMHDRRGASAAGLDPSGLAGNGRRASWRDPALPRMRHLVVTATSPGHRDARALHVHVANGSRTWPMEDRFRLRVPFAVASDGRPVGPLLLEGRVSRALDAAEPVRTEPEHVLLLCGKDRQALPVAGSCPPVRVDGLQVLPAE